MWFEPEQTEIDNCLWCSGQETKFVIITTNHAIISHVFFSDVTQASKLRMRWGSLASSGHNFFLLQLSDDCDQILWWYWIISDNIVVTPPCPVLGTTNLLLCSMEFTPACLPTPLLLGTLLAMAGWCILYTVLRSTISQYFQRCLHSFALRNHSVQHPRHLVLHA